jgi:hypothetical protein
MHDLHGSITHIVHMYGLADMTVRPGTHAVVSLYMPDAGSSNWTQTLMPRKICVQCTQILCGSDITPWPHSYLNTRGKESIHGSKLWWAAPATLGAVARAAHRWANIR